jgi:hypothetical protein
MRLTQMAIEGDAATIQYLAMTGTRTLVHGAILRTANRIRTPDPVLTDLQHLLPRLDSETNAYTKALRIDFTFWAYPTTDVKLVAEEWSKPSAMPLIEFHFDKRLHRAVRILTDPGLVALHPLPLDEIAEVNSAVVQCRVCRTNALSPWKDRSTIIEEEAAKNARSLIYDIWPLMYMLKDEPLPLNRQAITMVRNTYLAITNPLGRIFSCSHLSFAMPDRWVFRSRTEREAVRAVLAAKIFEHRKGQLPASLRDLVAENLLDSLPTDYYSGEPLKYSKARRVVWSVFENRVDDGGKGEEQPRWAQPDAVWKIPESLNP